jgi:phage tail-like protein
MTLTPPAAFSFSVTFGSQDQDTSFQEVSGISSEMNTEDVVEGGENNFVHKLPTGIKGINLELKRGIAPLSSALVTWCKSVLEGGFTEAIVPKTILVHLLDENQDPLRSWEFANAYPIKWDVEGFNSTKNELAIEKIVLAYNTLKRIK